MPSYKELRKQLRGDNANQTRLKSILEGQRNLDRQLEARGVEFVTIEERVRLVSLPLSREFLDAMLLYMTNLAMQRIKEEEGAQTLPRTRLYRVLTDVKKIYGEAKKRGVSKKMVDVSGFDIEQMEFPTREGLGRHGELFSTDPFRAIFIRTNWDRLGVSPTSMNSVFFPKFFGSFKANLTSYDFTLNPEDQAIERIEVYSHILAMRGLCSKAVPPQYEEYMLEDYFDAVIDISKEHLGNLGESKRPRAKSVLK